MTFILFQNVIRFKVLFVSRKGKMWHKAYYSVPSDYCIVRHVTKHMK